MTESIEEIVARHKALIKEAEKLEGSLNSIFRFYNAIIWFCVVYLVLIGVFIGFALFEFYIK